MSYQILYENTNENIFSRLMKIRNIDDDIESFLNPSFSNYWLDPYLLNDFDKAIYRIEKAIQNNEKIMVFGDYDVDWITWSYLIYTFFSKFLGYKNISIRLPNRLEDWYWIKDYHLDEIKSQWVSLVITVDNWITAIKEAIHARNIWLDIIITDHHKQLDEIPQWYAVVNPQISPNYYFKWISWVWVAFKLVSALSNKLIKDNEKKKQVINYLLPIVAIWTVADCVPLVHENRLFVKLWLEYINKRKWIPPSLDNFLNYLNIKWDIDTFHIWFLIAPRINAWWRIMSPYDSLHCLLYSDPVKQIKYLDKIEELNQERKKIQEELFKKADQLIDKEKNILIAASDWFHEWIIWIVAWRLTEKHYKPSIILAIDEEKWVAVWSLRWPDYFSVIELLYHIWEDLDRFWWHKQAWWMTVKLDKLETVINKIYEYCEKNIQTQEIKKLIYVDTPIYNWELKTEILWDIDKFAPYWEWNPQPIFLLEDIVVNSAEKVWKTGNWHLKLHVSKAWNNFPVLFWGKWWEIENIERNIPKKIIWKIRKDEFNWWFFIDWNSIID